MLPAAAANAQETFRDNPEALEYMTAENLPESFRATITRRDLTCAEIRPIPKLSGVDTFFVGRPDAGERRPTRDEGRVLNLRSTANPCMASNWRTGDAEVASGR